MSPLERLSRPWLCLAAACVVMLLGSRPATAAANRLSPREAAHGWILLFDGATTAGWTPRGNTDWQVENGTLTPKPGTGGGFLCTTSAFADFELHAEFWIDAAANSGVFLRCPRTGEITPATAYEVNIFDAHEKWPTGSINDVARCRRTTRSVGRWTTYDIRAEGPRFVVRLNGRKVLDVEDGRHPRGLIGLQTLDGKGTIRFRNVKLRSLVRHSQWKGADPATHLAFGGLPAVEPQPARP